MLPSVALLPSVVPVCAGGPQGPGKQVECPRAALGHPRQPHTVYPVAKSWAWARSCADCSDIHLSSSDWQGLNFRVLLAPELPQNSAVVAVLVLFLLPVLFMAKERVADPSGCFSLQGGVWVREPIEEGAGSDSLAPPSPHRGGRKGQRGPRLPSPLETELEQHVRLTVTLRPLAHSHCSCPEERTGCPGRVCWWAKCQPHSCPELPILGPVVLCARSSNLVVVGSHATKVTLF